MLAAATYRPAADQLFLKPVVGFSPANSAPQWIQSYLTNSSYTAVTLPPNVALTTLRRWNGEPQPRCKW